MKKKLSMLACIAMALCMALGGFAGCSGCSSKKVSNEKTAFVIMSEEMDGVFNPFFYTAGPDGEVVGMTQVSMFSSDDKGELSCGDNEPAVVLDYKMEQSSTIMLNGKETSGRVENGKNIGFTTYTFVLKNGIKFSDGVPLSIRDVLFNMYVYLDPVYTGSTTMYSTDIVGLSNYRTQSTAATEEEQDGIALDRAIGRLANLRNAVDAMIKEHDANSGSYKNYEIDTTGALMANGLRPDNLREDLVARYGEVGNGNNTIVKDYDRVRELFRKEVEDDYKGSIEAYKDAPYNMTDIQGFLYSEGFIKWDKKKQEMENADSYAHITTQEAAIDYVETAKIPKAFSEVASYWGTAGEIRTEFAAEAREALLTGGNADGTRDYPNISGIVAVDGATTPEIKIGDKTYKVAALPHGDNLGDFNSDWSVKDDSKYQILQITINGVDPKAIWNFGFTVAPVHYYSPDLAATFSIDDNNFGVQYASLDFMNNTLKGGNRVGVPLGAGPYKATDRNDNDNPQPGDFKSDNIVHFIRNDNFFLGKPKIRLIRYQVVNQSQSINVVKNGSVHYTTPQATATNLAEIAANKKVLGSMQNTQLGYGYIGVNAGKIPDVNLRRAIMSACDTSLCMQYYTGTAERLAWPISKVSWAYPKIGDVYDDDYRYPYTTDEAAQAEVLRYMSLAGVKNASNTTLASLNEKTAEGFEQYQDAYYNNKRLKFTFTIAGANLSEHPTYNTFKKAADLLNACGWDIDVRADNYTLTKLSTGALDVWAAAWSTTIDPDMYQVYHRNSRATSVLNWGYPELKSGMTTNGYGAGTLSKDYNDYVVPLSKKIDEARKVTEREQRIPLYRECLEYVMDLAVELPTYQRKNIYLYNKDIVDGSTLYNSDSAFVSPLTRIWEVSLNEKK